MVVLFVIDVTVIYLTTVGAWVSITVCNVIRAVSVTVSQSVGDQVFPAFGTHRGNELQTQGLTHKHGTPP